MGSLALLAREQGHKVSGCDENTYPPMSDLLEEQGIEVINGYKVEDLPEADCYVIGNALSRGNPMIEEILDKRMNFVSGPEWMARNILKDKRVIAVSGTHGKTSTTSMIAWILKDLGFDPGYLIAGKSKNLNSSSCLGKGDLFVIEADEYDTAFFDKRAKFIHYNPEVLVINNLEFDHADIYEDLEQIKIQFHHLVRTLSSESLVISPKNEASIEDVLSRGFWSNRKEFNGNSECDNFYSHISEDYSSFKLSLKGEEASLKWNHFGEFNAKNAMAAVLSLSHFGISIKDSVNSLSSFEGVSRRQEVLLNKKEIVLIDDFAHHPTAIEQTLLGLRKRYPGKKIISLIELRSNTMRSGYHGSKLIDSTKDSDLTFWSCQDERTLNELVKESGPEHRKIDSTESLLSDITSNVTGNDLIVLMSNGSFQGLNKKIIQLLT